MEHNLSKYVRFVRKQDELEKTISAIKSKNAQIKEKTEQIEKQVEQMAPAAEALNSEKLDGVTNFIYFNSIYRTPSLSVSKLPSRPLS